MARIATYDTDVFAKAITKAITARNSCSSMSDQLRAIARCFIDTPYAIWCVGEGPQGKYCQKPIYRTDVFDCMTFTNTVLAILHSANFAEFKHNYYNIQYRGKVNYFNRNYFLEQHWLQHNQHKNIEFCMQQLATEMQLPLHQAKTYLDYAGWVQQHTAEDIFLLPDNPLSESELLQQFKQEGASLTGTANTLPYFAIDDLLALQQAISSKPLLAIVVRPNWDVTHLIGTHLNVSHVGFVVGDDFYHASSYLGKVVKQNFRDYLQFARDVSGAAGFYFALTVRN